MKIASVLAFVAATPGMAGGVTSPLRVERAACPSDPDLAMLVAGSNLILVGRMAPPPRLRPGDAPSYQEIAIAIDQVLKGSGSGAAAVRHYSEDEPYAPTNAAIAALAGKPALLFLSSVDAVPGGSYFAGYTPSALRPALPDTTMAVEAEIARQQTLLQHWRPDTSLPFYAEVAALIARLGEARGEAQQQIFDRLVALGPGAVPAIVAQMDDRRELRDHQIRLRNESPDAFETFAQYGPEKVVDGLAAVLGQLAHRNYGNVENGGSERERAAVVAGWRVYASDLHCAAG